MNMTGKDFVNVIIIPIAITGTWFFILPKLEL